MGSLTAPLCLFSVGSGPNCGICRPNVGAAATSQPRILPYVGRETMWRHCERLGRSPWRVDASECGIFDVVSNPAGHGAENVAEDARPQTTIWRYGRSDNRQFSPRAAGCLGGTVSEGEGMPSSALPVGCTRSLDPFRPAADSAETVEEKIYDLALSRNGGIFLTARNPVPPISLCLLYPKRGLRSPTPFIRQGTLLRHWSRRLSFEFFGFRPPHGFVSINLIYRGLVADPRSYQRLFKVNWT